MNSTNDLYRANAIRVLCRIIDNQMLLQIERYLKQARSICVTGGGQPGWLRRRRWRALPRQRLASLRLPHEAVRPCLMLLSISPPSAGCCGQECGGVGRRAGGGHPPGGCQRGGHQAVEQRGAGGNPEPAPHGAVPGEWRRRRGLRAALWCGACSPGLRQGHPVDEQAPTWRGAAAMRRQGSHSSYPCRLAERAVSLLWLLCRRWR